MCEEHRFQAGRREATSTEEKGRSRGRSSTFLPQEDKATLQQEGDGGVSSASFYFLNEGSEEKGGGVAHGGFQHESGRVKEHSKTRKAICRSSGRPIEGCDHNLKWNLPTQMWLSTQDTESHSSIKGGG